MTIHKMLGWHWTNAEGTLGYADGRQVVAGETLKVDCEPVLCRAGLHASARVLDALGYAPGPRVWHVELGGVVVRGDDKSVATERTALWSVDCSEILRRFARKCALDVIHLWDAPDIVVSYLKTGDESVRDAAGDAAWAAWAATRAASWAATRDATRAATRDATRAAAWDATRDAAWDATRDASWAAARAAARAKQNRRLTAMISAARVK